jgi:hypothetical protein
MSHVRGAAIAARIHFVRERHGEGGVAALMECVAAATQPLVAGPPDAGAWVPFAAFVDVSVAIDRLFGEGDLSLCRELGAHAAEVNLPTVYRLFYRLGSPQYIFRRAAQLWGMHYDSGQLAAMEVGPGTVRLEILAFATPHRAHCLSVLGWAIRSIELSGGTVLAAQEAGCRARGDEACEMHLAWR